ncbi:MAG: NUDIX domain-containing protein [Nanoarchaeota archaeon]
MINGTLCYLKSGGETLFLHRNRKGNDIHSGFYVAPGGRPESGERGIDCLIREFEEETGLVVHDPRLKAIATFYNQDRLLGSVTSPEDWLVEIYTATKFSGRLKEEEGRKSPPLWIPDRDVFRYPMHEGDRRIPELFGMEGIFQVLVKYDGTKLTHFNSVRVDISSPR